ncbi:MAG: hypothetical protein R3B13_26800 [Polyangiaceae bacterium]
MNGWPATTINDPEFGVRIVAENTGTTLATANVDSVQITLFYTSGPALWTQVAHDHQQRHDHRKPAMGQSRATRQCSTACTPIHGC